MLVKGGCCELVSDGGADELGSDDTNVLSVGSSAPETRSVVTVTHTRSEGGRGVHAKTRTTRATLFPNGGRDAKRFL